MTSATEAPFGSDYWTSDSVYSKYPDYATGLQELRGFMRGLIRRAQPFFPPCGRHLDAGCGHGAVVHELLDAGWDSYGCDLSEWMVGEARAHAPQCAERFAVGDIADPPFPGAFDLITCFEVLEHIEDPLPALHALAGRLRPGGRLVFSTPNAHTRLPLMPDPRTSDPTHVCIHEPSWWAGAAEHAGMKVVHVGTQIPVPLIWRVHPMFAYWLPLGRRVGPDALVVAEAAR